MTVLIEADPRQAETIGFSLGQNVTTVESPAGAHRRLVDDPQEVVVVVGPDTDLTAALDLSTALQTEKPHVGVILMRHRVDVTVLGQALRAGVREVVTPDDLAALGAAVRRSVDISRRQLGASGAGMADARPEGRVITVFSAKGGCGKTTVSTNLATTLANNGASSVCIVDLDLAFGDVAIALQLVPARTITDAQSMMGTIDEQGIASLITPHSPGLDTLLAPLEPGEADRIDPKLVTELVRVLRRMYDFVVIDTPPAFTEHVLASFDISDSYVLLATLDIPALKNLRLTLEMLDLLGYPRESWIVVLNRADSKVGLGVDEVERTLKVPISVQIPSSRAVSASINKGVPIVLDEPNHPVSGAIRRIAVEVAQRVGGPAAHRQTAEPKRRGFLRRSGAR